MKQIRIVVADDNEKMRNIILKSVSADEELCVVGMAQNGLEACELVRSQKPDVLLLDLIMPKLDGMSVLERLTAASSLPRRPYVIMISAVGSEGMIKEAFSKGVSYYFVKPFVPETLVNRIKAVVHDKGSRLAFARRIESGENMEVVFRREIENEITGIFRMIGIPAHLKGYLYLRDAILKVCFHVSEFCSITKEIYPSIAEKYCVNANQVERAMRHAIEVGWNRGNLNTIDNVFGYTVEYERGKPTNSEFIALIADKLRVEFL